MSLDKRVAASGRYRAETPWRPFSAVLAAVAVIAVSLALPVFIVIAVGGSAGSPAAINAWGPMLLSQVLMTAGAWWLAGRMGGTRSQVLALGAPPRPVALVFVAFLVIGLTSLAYTFAIFGWRPDVVLADMETFRPLVKSTVWPIYALIISVGAPLSEELLFRGFLQSSLATTRIGFVGASIVTTLLWSALHFQYSIFGLAEIVVVGFSLCWVLQRTGSLWATILIHALYNGAQFVGMRFSLFPWT